MIETNRRLENLLHPGVKDPAQLTSEVHLFIWVFVRVNTFKYVSSDSQVAVVSELTRLFEWRVVQPICPAVCRFLLECQNSLLVLGIPRREEMAESARDHFIVTLFISVVYHMSNNILGFIPENMYTFPKFYLFQQSYMKWRSYLALSVIRPGWRNL